MTLKLRPEKWRSKGRRSNDLAHRNDPRSNDQNCDPSSAGLRRNVDLARVHERIGSLPRRLPFRPKLAKWKADHPRAYASRHVLLALLEILGISAFLGAVLPRLPWRLPQWDLSWLPDIDMWGWIPMDLPEVPEWLSGYKWVVVLLIAVAVAVAEVDRYKRKRSATKTD